MSGTKSTAPETLEERPRIYVASKSDLHGYWRTWRATGQSDGFEVISTWIDEGDEGETADWSDLWVRCVTEAATADAVVALYRPGDVWKGALVEIGAALAAGKPVHLIGEPNHSWVAHPLVRQFETVDDAFAALLPPAPEPIKVGDRVQFVDNPRTGTLVAVDEWEAWVRWDVGARTQVAFERLRRVDSSPSPEPERKVEDVIAAASAAGVIGAGLHPAPSPSPEVGEGAEPHESEDPEELAAAAAAGLTVDFWGVLSKRWMRSGVELSAEGYRRRIGKGERFQIHGTVPGYGETGGAS